MEWNEQSVEEAIQTARARNAIFVVYVQDGRKSTSLHNYIESTAVARLLMNPHFVAIRIFAGDQNYRDFASIYQLVPIPSLFFIGPNGWPLEIITGEMSQSTVVHRIQYLLRQLGFTPSGHDLNIDENTDNTPSSPTISVTTTTSSTCTLVPYPAEMCKDEEVNVDGDFPEPETSMSSSSIVSDNARSDNLNRPCQDENVSSKITSQNMSLTEAIDTAGVSASSQEEQAKILFESSNKENKSPSSLSVEDKPQPEPRPVQGRKSCFSSQNRRGPSSSSVEDKPQPEPRHVQEGQTSCLFSSQDRRGPSSSSVEDKPQPEPRHVQEDQMSRLSSLQDRTGHSLNRGQVPRVPQSPDSPCNVTGLLVSIRGWMQRILQAGGGVTTGSKAGHLRNACSSEMINVPGGSSRSQVYEPSNRPSGDPGFAHIQFRLPDGSTHSTTFPTETTIREVREYVQSNIPLQFRDFGLSTTYPRLEFTDEHTSATLFGLGLVPRTVILIIPSTEAARPALSTVSDSLWVVITWPFSAVYSAVNYLNFFLFGQAEIGDQSGSQLPTRNRNPPNRNQSTVRRRVPQSSTVQRDGNVYRLSNRQDDTDDENNTWNGNSTQQM